MKRTIFTIVIVVGILALIGWILINNKKENQAKTDIVAKGTGAVIVRTATVSKSPLNLDFSANGNFAAWQDLSLLAENSGRITQILVDEGAHVNKGQVLARIDDKYLSLALQTAKDNLSKLKTDQQRYESSFKTGGVTKAQLDEINLNVRNAENQFQEAQRRLADSYVKAPIAGIINKRNIEVGAYVSPGTALFDIVDVSRLKLLVNANELQVVNLKLGDQVKITSTVFPDNVFSGKISFIAAKSDNTLNYPVEIRVENSSNQQLKAGMYGTATFELPKQEPTIIIPRGAFVGSVSSNEVFILENGNTAKLRKVTAGRNLGEQVEILSGLKEGEVIITSGQINLVDGTEVKPQALDSTKQHKVSNQVADSTNKN
ncbi:efflux RND transporter periplasmic adaptor subunit [Olivibacter ginsenosidimutans]|uniref:Efflux RND transporter periplasmic adaptor subunit n=1 Tax=Olivibacter ginsenosidimutans TaxID=1176537 RepID=A0ABP9AQ80_9SPHI